MTPKQLTGPSRRHQEDGQVSGEEPHRGGSRQAGRPPQLQEHEAEQGSQQGGDLEHCSWAENDKI